MNFHANSISALKDQLFNAREAISKIGPAIIKRDEIDNRIVMLEQEIEQNNLSMRRSRHELSSLSLAILEKQELLKELRSNLQEIDLFLDHWEDLSEQTIDEMKCELIQMICAVQSDEADIEPITAKMKNDEEAIGKIDVAMTICLTLEKILQKIFAIRKSINGRGILNYILGKSPNFAIAECFLEGDIAIQAALPVLRSYYETSPLLAFKLVCKELITLLEDVQMRFRSRWGFSTIDKLLAESERRLLKYLNNLSEIRALTDADCRKAERLIDEWIDRHD